MQKISVSFQNRTGQTLSGILDLRSATTAVTHRRIHAEGCADCDSAEGRVDECRRVITLEGG